MGIKFLDNYAFCTNPSYLDHCEPYDVDWAGDRLDWDFNHDTKSYGYIQSFNDACDTDENDPLHEVIWNSTNVSKDAYNFCSLELYRYPLTDTWFSAFVFSSCGFCDANNNRFSVYHGSRWVDKKIGVILFDAVTLDLQQNLLSGYNITSIYCD